MREPIKLFVDDLREGGTLGIVSKADKIFHNAGAIHQALLEELKDSLAKYHVATAIVDAGRFVCVITMSLDATNSSMIIHDLKNDEKRAKGELQVFRTNEMSDRFMAAFQKIGKKSEKELNNFSIVLSDIF
jgi:hypothetical protein